MEQEKIKQLNMKVDKRVWQAFEEYLDQKNVPTIREGLEYVLEKAVKEDIFKGYSSVTMSRGIFFSELLRLLSERGNDYGAKVVKDGKTKYINVNGFLVYPVYKVMGDESQVMQIPGKAVSKLYQKSTEMELTPCIVICLILYDEVIVRAFNPNCLELGIPKETVSSVFISSLNAVYLRTRTQCEIDNIKALNIKGDIAGVFDNTVMNRLEKNIEKRRKGEEYELQ